MTAQEDNGTDKDFSLPSEWARQQLAGETRGTQKNDNQATAPGAP
jgi:hypothetical protein